MKIVQGPPSSAPTRKRGVDAARGGGGFASHVSSRPDTTGLAPAAPLTALGSLLAVQEVEDGGGQRRQAIDHGHQLLDELHELRLAMVDGWLSEDNLHRLAGLVEQARPEVEDGELASTLEDIELRAAVELAKLERHRS